MTVQEILQMVDEECKKAGFKYMIHIDDGEHISGQYSVTTNSRLHDMARACNKLSDTSSEHEIINN